MLRKIYYYRMIPPIAKFTIGFNTSLALLVFMDVHKEHKRIAVRNNKK
jgi:hypothetical protein